MRSGDWWLPAPSIPAARHTGRSLVGRTFTLLGIPLFALGILSAGRESASGISRARGSSQFPRQTGRSPVGVLPWVSPCSHWGYPLRVEKRCLASSGPEDLRNFVATLVEARLAFILGCPPVRIGGTVGRLRSGVRRIPAPSIPAISAPYR